MGATQNTNKGDSSRPEPERVIRVCDGPDCTKEINPRRRYCSKECRAARKQAELDARPRCHREWCDNPTIGGRRRPGYCSLECEFEDRNNEIVGRAMAINWVRNSATREQLLRIARRDHDRELHTLIYPEMELADGSEESFWLKLSGGPRPSAGIRKGFWEELMNEEHLPFRNESEILFF